MTKEQEKAIERCNKLIETEHSNWIGITNQKAIETVLNMLKEKDTELEKKDKMIDLMAEHICSSAIVDDTVCAIKCDCETDIREDCTYEKMLNCTKQYFERKAEQSSSKTQEKIMKLKQY